MKRIAASLLSLALFSACYIDDMPERERYKRGGRPEDRGTGLHARKRECKKDRETACLVGQIVSGQTIYVEGREFFNADAFASKIEEMVVLRDKDGKAIDGNTYDLTLEPKITNETFPEDFEVYLKGDQVVHVTADHEGYFNIDHLAEGEYDFRIQKKFLLKLSQHPAGDGTLPTGYGDSTGYGDDDSDAEPQEPTPPADDIKANERAYCLVIYSEEMGLDIFRREKLYRSVDRFRLQILDADCREAVKGGTVIIDSVAAD